MAKVELDAVVVGSGPNGLAAAVELARNGLHVKVFEARDEYGGGCRSSELTLPGFVHDVCSAIHPMVLLSPFFQQLPLESLGVKMIHPDAPVANPFDDGSSAFVERSVEETARGLGEDAREYKRLIGPHLAAVERLIDDVMGPLRIPRHPLVMGRFGLIGLRSAQAIAARFRSDRARGLFAGLAAHSMLRLDKAPTGAFGVFFAITAHAAGWPLVQGGSQKIADALALHLRELGGEIVSGHEVTSLAELPGHRAVLFDVTPRQLVRIAGNALPPRYTRRLGRYRYGPGVFKMDWALSEPIPWKDEACARAATVHIGPTLEEVLRSEHDVNVGRVPEKPFVLLAQQSLFDSSRAPEGKHTAWAYCHVPSGADVDMTDRIEDQVERFAPGFRDTIVARHALDAGEMERYNPNYVGGDINGGVQDLRQQIARPVARFSPYTTPNPRIYMCSSSTPPGGGVHGMCGYHAARAAMRRAF